MAENNPRGDELIGRTEAAEAEEGGGREMRAANLFDLRRIIGALFVIYGVILVITGLLDSDTEIAKAAGLRINFWEGLAMLIFGCLMLLWGFLRPLGQQLAEAEADAQSP